MTTRRLSLAGKKALEALNRLLRENGVPEIVGFEEAPLRIQEMTKRWEGTTETRIEKKKEEILLLIPKSDTLKTLIVKVGGVINPHEDAEEGESEFQEEKTEEK